MTIPSLITKLECKINYIQDLIYSLENFDQYDEDDKIELLNSAKENI